MSAATSSTMAVVTTLVSRANAVSSKLSHIALITLGMPLYPEVDLMQDFGRKDGLFFQPGPRQAGLNVLQRLFQLKGLQHAAESDALFQLAEIGGFEFAVQLRLAGQQNLEHFPAAVFQ